MPPGPKRSRTARTGLPNTCSVAILCSETVVDDGPSAIRDTANITNVSNGRTVVDLTSRNVTSSLPLSDLQNFVPPADAANVMNPKAVTPPLPVRYPDNETGVVTPGTTSPPVTASNAPDVFAAPLVLTSSSSSTSLQIDSSVSNSTSTNKRGISDGNSLQEALKVHSQAETLIPRGRRYRRLIGLPPDECDEDCMPQASDISCALANPHEFNRTLKAELDDLNAMNIMFDNVKEELYQLRSKVLDQQIDAIKSGDSDLLDPFILQALDADEYLRLQCMSKDFVRRQALVHQFELEYAANEHEYREELESFGQQCEQTLKQHMLALEYETLRPLLTRAVVAMHRRSAERLVANARVRPGLKWTSSYYGAQRVAAKLRLRRAKLDLDSMLRQALHEKYFGQRTHLLERELDALPSLMIDQVLEALDEHATEEVNAIELKRVLKSTNARFNALARLNGRPETRTPRSSPRRTKRTKVSAAETATADAVVSGSQSDADDLVAGDGSFVSDDILNRKIINGCCRSVVAALANGQQRHGNTADDWRNRLISVRQRIAEHRQQKQE